MPPALTNKKRLNGKRRSPLRIKTAFFWLIMLASLPSPALALQANGCPDYHPPTINVQQLVVTPRYNDTFDLPSLRLLAEQGGQSITSSRHETPVGLTAASLKLDSRYEVRVISSPDDQLVCAQVVTMNLSFGFDDTTVYIAREIPHGSCSYQTVMRHELQHVKTDQMLVDVTMPVLANYLRKALSEIGMIRASSPEAAERHLKTVVGDYMRMLGANLSQVRRNQQALIDTTAEYDRISESCNGALGDLIHAAKAHYQGRYR